MGYRNNPSQYVADLQAAADAGRWEEYTAIQGQLAVESTLWALQQAEQLKREAEKAREEAIREVDSRHPGFADRLQNGRELLQKERPRLAEAIEIAAQDASLKQDLVGLLESADDALSVRAANPRVVPHAVTAHSSRSLATSAGRAKVD